MGRAVDFKCLRLVLPANVVPAARTRAQSVRVPERHFGVPERHFAVGRRQAKRQIFSSQNFQLLAPP